MPGVAQGLSHGPATTSQGAATPKRAILVEATAEKERFENLKDRLYLSLLLDQFET